MGQPSLLTPHHSLYRGISLVRKRTPLGPYRRPMPGVLRGSYGDGRFLMGEVPLQCFRPDGCACPSSRAVYNTNRRSPLEPFYPRRARQEPCPHRPHCRSAPPTNPHDATKSTNLRPQIHIDSQPFWGGLSRRI